MAVKRPDWLKVRFSNGPNYQEVKGLLRGMALHTVCEEAHCPNIGECFESRTATFLILGNVCSRGCRFCAVEHGRPSGLDEEEPARVAEAVRQLSLRYVVVTSVTRDDLPDGGAAIFAATIREVRRASPDCGIEVLIPDFGGSREALAAVMAARPDILNHNVETVPGLYRRVRPQADYARSLALLGRAKEMDASVFTKSGVMVGVGETWDQLLALMADLAAVGCDILTIGQYLAPSSRHLPIERYYAPEEFAALKAEGERLGLRHVEAAPLVRSSYHAGHAASALTGEAAGGG
ncbi:MAG: lipoyl synthase [Dehalococcoidales bacterium]|nr:lipoyl synthase [Dehalococcoidales bacterium]